MTAIRPFCCIEFTGSQALKTLHGQATQDLLSAPSNEARLTAFLNPKGRMLATARAYSIGDCVRLITPTDTADDLIKHLTPMCHLARVQISRSALEVALTEMEDAPLPPGVLVRDDDTVRIGEYGHTAWIVSATAPPHEIQADIHRLDAGLAMIHAPLVDQLIPQQAHYQMLEGVSFTKGCYTGQEIVARLEHLGQAKKHLKRLTLSAPLALGETVQLDPETSVLVVDAAFDGVQGVALVLAPIDRVSEQLRDPPFEIVRQVAGQRPIKR